MDQIGLDVQVPFPTLFLQGMLTQFPEGQIALTRAYNRWLADVRAKGRGRLPSAVIPPLASMPDALANLRLKSGVDSAVIDKILDANARAFYGL